MGVAHSDPLFARVGPKTGNFYRFYQFFFRTTGLQLKLLILIESPDVFRWKLAKKVGKVLGQNLGQIRSNIVKKVKLALSIVFFIFCQGNTF